MDPAADILALALAPSTGGRFVLMTWNCFGAAQDALSFLRWRGAPDAHRFEVAEVVRSADGADVFCVQEVWLSEAETFFDRLAHSHKIRDPNRTTLWPPTFGGSGLGIASRFPIVRSSVRPFSRPHAGFERFARKGMMHVALRVEAATPFEIDVITTHFQSGFDAASRSVRDRQLRELRAFVDEVQAPERPFVICGDLNICGLSASRSASEYARLRDLLSDFADLCAPDDRPTFHPDPNVNELAHRFWREPPQRIDYILFRSARDVRLEPAECALGLASPFTVPAHGRTFASDHFALRAVFEIRCPDGQNWNL